MYKIRNPQGAEEQGLQELMVAMAKSALQEESVATEIIRGAGRSELLGKINALIDVVAQLPEKFDAGEMARFQKLKDLIPGVFLEN
jgi:hypothetical protein